MPSPAARISDAAVTCTLADPSATSNLPNCVPAGVAAARLAADAVLAVLEPKLPSGPPPPTEAPGFLPWREDVQLALVETLAELNRMFALKGILAGCTATLVLQVRDPLAPPRGSTPLEGAAHGNAATAPRARRAGVPGCGLEP